jgi:hypothetical protein
MRSADRCGTRLLLPAGDRIRGEVAVGLDPVEDTVAGQAVRHPGPLPEAHPRTRVHIQAETRGGACLGVPLTFFTW